MSDKKTPRCGVAIPNPDTDKRDAYPWVICGESVVHTFEAPTQVKLADGTEQVVVYLCEKHTDEHTVIRQMPGPKAEKAKPQVKDQKRVTRKSTAADKAAADKLEGSVK